jgi:hypothetical protein
MSSAKASHRNADPKYSREISAKERLGLDQRSAGQSSKAMNPTASDRLYEDPIEWRMIHRSSLALELLALITERQRAGMLA